MRKPTISKEKEKMIIIEIALQNLVSQEENWFFFLGGGGGGGGGCKKIRLNLAFHDLIKHLGNNNDS